MAQHTMTMSALSVAMAVLSHGFEMHSQCAAFCFPEWSEQPQAFSELSLPLCVARGNASEAASQGLTNYLHPPLGPRTANKDIMLFGMPRARNSTI